MEGNCVQGVEKHETKSDDKVLKALGLSSALETKPKKFRKKRKE